jgi:adenosylcobinamide-GDP ribazoletransferase
VDSLRLLFGTLTVLPVRPPTSVDRRTAGWAMTLAPLAGLVLAVLVGGPLLLVQEYADAPPLLVAALTIGALALLTRAMHLDGLADVADGMGSGRRGEAALAIMKKSDIGPFGVATLVLALLLQVAALAACLASGTGPAAVLVALVLSRGVLPLVCGPGFPAARPDGLGAVVAGTVTGVRYAVAVALVVALAAGAIGLLGGAGLVDLDAALRLLLTAPLALVPAAVLVFRAEHRFGGMTGDVYGAVVETTFTAALVLAALAV